jgi:hypothetical protein
MARYSAFLGRRVEVQYRAGDILLPASGTLVADSGRSIFLEQHLEQRGQMKQFRWEIPYQYIVRLEERSDGPADQDAAHLPSLAAPGTGEARQPKKNGAARNAVPSDASGADPLVPLHNPPKPA